MVKVIIVPDNEGIKGKWYNLTKEWKEFWRQAVNKYPILSRVILYGAGLIIIILTLLSAIH